jgi:hypothetical protein
LDAVPHYKHAMVLVGSCNQPISYRNLFDYKSRVRFITEIFPALPLAPLPDFSDNETWLGVIDQLIRLAKWGPENAVFVGGCKEDIEVLEDSGRETIIINRFGGMTCNVSGTEIRDHLITGNKEKLADFVDHRIIPDVMDTFKIQWDKLRRQ